MSRLGADERGVSEVVGYVLSVVIVSATLFGIVVSAEAYADRRAAVAAGNDLEGEGQRLARTVGIVDRLVRTSDSGGEIGRRIALPKRVAGERYTIRVVNRSLAGTGEPCDRPCLVLSTDDVRRRVFLAPVTELRAGRVRGGSLYVVRPAGEDRIEVEFEE